MGDVETKKPSVKGPDEWFTGNVWIDALVEASAQAPLNVGLVHFTPGARTAWHTHQGGQTLIVAEGRGLVQSRGQGVTELRAGDVHRTPDGEQHWHGATPGHLLSHYSLTLGPATWSDHVSDAEYGEAAEGRAT